MNRSWQRELRRRGHRLTAAGGGGPRPDVVIHHDFTRSPAAEEYSAPVPHVAVRTWDFGPHPTEWIELVNRHCAQLWVHSTWVRDHALEGGADPSRVRVVPHGIDPAVFRPDGPSYPVPSEKRFRYLFVGGAIERKGIDILLDAYLEAFTADDDVSLIVKDHSDNRFYREVDARDRIARLARDPAVPEVVHLDRHLTADDLAALYRACDMGVWPYRAEGFLIPALESLACGTPTMIPEIGPTADFSDHSTSVLVPSLDVRLPYRRRFRLRLDSEVHVEGIHIVEVRPSVLAESMRAAYDADPRLLREKGARGAARAHGDHTWAHVADVVEDCLVEITR